MAKKFYLILVLVILASGTVFAQGFPMNSLTVDIGPTIIGFAGPQFIKVMSEDSEDSFFGFGIGAQFERHLTQAVSLAARYAYLGFGLSVKDNNFIVDMDVKSHSAEGHVRFYPFAGRSFFLDGMIGYAWLSMGFESSDYSKTESLDLTANYLKYGAKIGWKIDFGKPGGFILEPSFGWNFKTMLNSSVAFDKIENEYDVNSREVADIAADWIFVGGPRISIALGFRF